jgi:hypothetical protein
MAQKRKIEHQPEFLSPIIISSGASLNKTLVCSTEGGEGQWSTVGTSGISTEAIIAEKIANGTITAEKIASNTITESRMKSGAISLEKLSAVVKKQLPAEHGRSAEMVAGKITIAAPAVTATGAIVVNTEGGTAIAASVVERTAGTGFKVEAAETSTDRINWAVWTE